MTNKEMLGLAKKNQISPYALVIASEVENIFGKEYVDFEKVCDRCYHLYLKYDDMDITPNEIVQIVYELVEVEQLDLTQIAKKTVDHYRFG